MSTEALLLALTAVIRPTTLAALFAILSTSRPQRLLVTYLVTGLAFSLAVGMLVVGALRGIDWALSSTTSHPVFDIVLGGAALGYAGAVWAGWTLRRDAPGPADGPGWMRRRLQRLSARTAAAAGVLTHLPGVVYLAALNAIAADAMGFVDEVFQVALYNAIWFSLPIVALVLAVRRPEISRELLERLRSLALRYQRWIVVVFLIGLGGYLVFTGTADLVRSTS